MSKVLIVGASGLVGYAAAKHFSRLPGWEVLAVSRRQPDGLENVKTISVDLMDRQRCTEVFGQLGVTHIVYAALYEAPGLLGGWVDADAMQTNLRLLQNVFDPIEAGGSLQHISLMQGAKAYGMHLGPIPVPARERAPRHPHANFYWLQEDYLKEKQHGKPWHWTILRPPIICGISLGSNMNSLAAIGVYAALLKEAGRPLSYPGGPSSPRVMVDSELLARSFGWAATAPTAQNQTFNITNGDEFTWHDVWPVIAEAMGMEVGPPARLSLAEELPRREAEWAEIVKKYELRAPASVQEFLGQSAIFADLLLGHALKAPPPPILLSTIKIRQAGFADCMDTEDMFRKWYKRFQELRLLPRV